MGFILLEGGSEFTAGMAAADERAMAVCGGRAQPVRIIPAAAAPDHNHARAAANGVGWFQSLGAADVRAVGIIDRASADRPDLASEIERARLVFVLGGFTRYLAETLSGSLAWQAMLSAHRAGAVIAGSSAGAMVLCERYFDPELRHDPERLESGAGEPACCRITIASEGPGPRDWHRCCQASF